MKESYSVSPEKGFNLSVGKFEATMAIGKKTSGSKKTKEDIAYFTISVPGLYKAKVLHKGKQKVKFERTLTVTIPVSKAYKKDFVKCFKALERNLDKAKPKIRMLPS